MNIAFIGLGNMGSGMATNLIKAGHTLTVFNRSRARADALKPLGARVAATPGEAAAGAEVAVTMLADDHALEAVVFEKGKGILDSLPPNAIHVSMSTISVAFSRRLAAAEENGVPMPMASLIRDRFLAALGQGMGELDWSAISKLSAKDAGL